MIWCTKSLAQEFLFTVHVSNTVGAELAPALAARFLDGLAIIVHPDNPVNSLEVSQIAQLFSGEITSWRQLDRPDLSVTSYARDDHSGAWDTFKSLVLAKKYQLAHGVERFESNELPSARVLEKPGAIGFVSLKTIGVTKAVNVEIPQVKAWHQRL